VLHRSVTAGDRQRFVRRKGERGVMCVRQPRTLFHPHGDDAIPRKPQVQLVEVESGDAFFEAQG
jgi:hypothetical protein